MAPRKIEAIFFHDGLRGKPPKAQITVDDIPVQLSNSLKYLGLQLDGKWNFCDHFGRLEWRLFCALGRLAFLSWALSGTVPPLPHREDRWGNGGTEKIGEVTAALCRLMPNLGRPDDRVHKLYAGTVNSMALYGALVWADEAMATKRIRDILHRIQRRVAIRLVRDYRTVSHAAASILAGLPPHGAFGWGTCPYLRQSQRAPEMRVTITARVRGVARLQARRQMMEKWEEYITSIPLTESGKRVAGAMGPILNTSPLVGTP
ncbi:uncharacterized protein [Anoplolepis gracilipes]|uniref:uncharacterized protein n=1 Tax=Anoplolepis gracilipes TaxID=354296 RepID=UPI003B9FC721